MGSQAWPFDDGRRAFNWSYDELRRRRKRYLNEDLFAIVPNAKAGESRAMMEEQLALNRKAPNLAREMHSLRHDRYVHRRVAADA